MEKKELDLFFLNYKKSFKTQVVKGIKDKTPVKKWQLKAKPLPIFFERNTVKLWMRWSGAVGVLFLKCGSEGQLCRNRRKAIAVWKFSCSNIWVSGRLQVGKTKGIHAFICKSKTRGFLYAGSFLLWPLEFEDSKGLVLLCWIKTRSWVGFTRIFQLATLL